MSNHHEIPDVSLKLEHMISYMHLARAKQDEIHGFIKSEWLLDTSNTVSWLLHDVETILREVREDLYPKEKITTN